MHRYGDQIEFRVDRRHLFLFFLGGVFWTLVTFFFGMTVAGGGKKRVVEKGLVALGWLDQAAYRRRQMAVGFTFKKKRPAPLKAPGGGKEPRSDASSPVQGRDHVDNTDSADDPTPRHAAGDAGKPHKEGLKRRKARKLPKIRKQARPARRKQARRKPRKPAALKKAPRRGGKKYTVEMRFRSAIRASQVMKKLRHHRFRPRLKTVRHRRGHYYHRIRVGRFHNTPAAARWVPRLRELSRSQPQIRSLR